jgi:hypothetical protein
MFSYVETFEKGSILGKVKEVKISITGILCNISRIEI